jgi:PPOX class probable F420-dependent enzyme
LTPLTDEIRAFLAERHFAVAATINPDGSPQQSVMWYELRGDLIMMNTRVGRQKELNLKRDPRISLCIENEYDYVTLTGTATLDYDHERSQADIRALALRYKDEEEAGLMVRNTFSKQHRVTIHMTVDKVDLHY